MSQLDCQLRSRDRGTPREAQLRVRRRPGRDIIDQAKGMLMDRFDIDAARTATGTVDGGPPPAQRRAPYFRAFDPTVRARVRSEE